MSQTYIILGYVKRDVMTRNTFSPNILDMAHSLYIKHENKVYQQNIITYLSHSPSDTTSALNRTLTSFLML